MAISTTMKKGPPGQRVYEMPFKIAIVKEVIEGGKRPSVVAKEKQLSVNNVSKWVQQAYRGLLPGYQPTTLEQAVADPIAEIKRLRKALSDMTAQRDFLKKTTQFFVKEPW